MFSNKNSKCKYLQTNIQNIHIYRKIFKIWIFTEKYSDINIYRQIFKILIFPDTYLKYKY